MTETDDDLVDDPFVPGRQCKRWQAKVHPSVRFAETVGREMAARPGGAPVDVEGGAS